MNPNQSAMPPGSDEFAAGAAFWPGDLSRREFLQRLGASLALLGSSGCLRQADRIVPRVVADARAGSDGRPISFATAISIEGFARGILVTARNGRPIKIEGNPDHPESLGATDVFTQAAILGLYDPDRSSAPLRAGAMATWNHFESDWLARRADLLARRGEGMAFLTEPTTSPTVLREIRRVLDVFSAARWFQHTPLARYDRAGRQADHDVAAADVIFLIGSDCFYRHPAAVRYGRALAARRRLEQGQTRAPRFHAIEATPTVSGALADFRLPASLAQQRVLLDALARELAGDSIAGSLERDGATFIQRLASDLQAHRGRVVCVAGPENPDDILDFAAALNAQFGERATQFSPALRSDADPRGAGDLTALVHALEHDEVQTLFVLGSNPAYTAPGDVDAARLLRRVSFSVHLGGHCDETGALATWHLPESHFLETWSDLRAYSGLATIQQPLVEPMHASRSMAEMLRLISAPPGASAYDLVRETWRELPGDAADFETRWHRWLDRGVVEEEAPAPRSPAVASHDLPRLATAAPARTSLSVVFQPDPNVLDGRFANNGWLQELPKPLTHLVWENAALISASLAAEFALANGDVVACTAGRASLEAPVWIMPGQAAKVVTLTLGYGRARAGVIGDALGYDAYRLRTGSTPWTREGVTLRKLGRRHALVSTQHHFTMDGRDLVRVLTPEEAAHASHAAAPRDSLFPEWPRDRYAWGMSIDLATCLGCNACVIACQAENNIPIVGKEQVARGREMHWLRIDRYQLGDAANPRFLAQPVPCMQCEHAPCEIVCPVGATVHSSEGLNDMVYNRCIGTRYCSNNCPYKVRRFNFLDYRAPDDSPLQQRANPTVSIRERGVMEKCTYCVQRINAARIAADRENRAIRDGEVRTACQQACPAEAIVFGDLNDPRSRVSQRKAEATDYALLEELNTRPRTTYLAAVRHAPIA